jgi:hypothetical protein
MRKSRNYSTATERASYLSIPTVVDCGSNAEPNSAVIVHRRATTYECSTPDVHLSHRVINVRVFLATTAQCSRY